MTDDGDDASLTPYELETVAWMEDELDLRDPALPGCRAGRLPARQPGPMTLVGAGIAAFGAVVAFTAATPLALAGWILLLIGFVIVWQWV